MFTTRHLFVPALFSCALAVAACGQAAPASSATVAASPPAGSKPSPAGSSQPSPVATAAASAALTPLKFVYDNQSIGVSPLWAMDEAGIFKKYGLNAQLEFAEGTVGAQAMVASQYPVGDVSASAVIATSAQQSGLKLVGAMNTKLIYALVASKGITGIQDLRGKTFAIAKLGDSSDTATRLIVRKLGLDPDKDIKVLQVGNSPARYAALVSGNVQAILADPMDIVRARRDGYSVVADQAALNIPYAGSTIAMTQAYIRDHRDEAKRVLMALEDGTHYYKTHQEEVATIAGKHLKSDDREALLSAGKVFSDTIMPDKMFVPSDGLQPIIDDVALRNPAAKDAPFDRFADNSLLDEIDKSGFIDGLLR
jgi:NitT/TauT family transport system substrate-binding protein